MEKKSVGWEGFKGFWKGYFLYGFIGGAIATSVQSEFIQALALICVFVGIVISCKKATREAREHNSYIEQKELEENRKKQEANRIKQEEHKKSVSNFINSKVMEKTMNTIRAKTVRRIEIREDEVCCWTLSGVKLVSNYREYGYKSISSSFAKEIVEELLNRYMEKNNYQLREIEKYFKGSGEITGVNVVNNPYNNSASVFVDRDYGTIISLGYAIELKEKEQSKTPQLKDW